MKQTADRFTSDMLNPARGRPPLQDGLTPKERAALRKRKSRAAKADTVSTLSVELPNDVVEAMREFLQFKDETQNQLIERLLRSQLLRKR
jgi:hypothetical protein